MPKYVIEREVHGAGELNAQQLKDLSRTSCSVLRKLGFEIQWIQSFVTGDKIYCIYVAPSEGVIREHAHRHVVVAHRRALLLLGHLPRGLDDRPQQIGIVVGGHALHDRRHALEARAGIDGRPRQRL